MNDLAAYEAKLIAMEEKLNLARSGLAALQLALDNNPGETKASQIWAQRSLLEDERNLLEAKFDAQVPDVGGIALPTKQQITEIGTIADQVEVLNNDQAQASAGIQLAGKALDLMIKINATG